MCSSQTMMSTAPMTVHNQYRLIVMDIPLTRKKKLSSMKKLKTLQILYEVNRWSLKPFAQSPGVTKNYLFCPCKFQLTCIKSSWLKSALFEAIILPRFRHVLWQVFHHSECSYSLATCESKLNKCIFLSPFTYLFLEKEPGNIRFEENDIWQVP